MFRRSKDLVLISELPGVGGAIVTIDPFSIEWIESVSVDQIKIVCRSGTAVMVALSYEEFHRRLKAQLCG